MGKNKVYRKQLEGHRQALAEHLTKIAKERENPADLQDESLIAHWEKTVANCRQQIASWKGGSRHDAIPGPWVDDATQAVFG